jgi:glucosyl-3-phosphoglycerate phosphatase
VLVRHGETTWNADGRWQGQGGEGLSERGAAQAARTAHHLAESYADAVLIARSDSRRVIETAEPLAARLEIPVVADPRLREIDVGRWSGRTRAEVQRLDPRGWAAYRAGEDVPIGGGESVEQMRRRVIAALHDVIAKVGAGTGIVISHGWALRAAIAELLAAPDGGAALPRVPNCAITILDVRRRNFQLVSYGKYAHLEADGLMPRSASVADHA